MVQTDIKTAFRDAELVRHSEVLPLFVVWRGGITFNVYTTGPSGEPPIKEVDVFSVLDADGNPVSRDKAERKIIEYLERVEAAP